MRHVAQILAVAVLVLSAVLAFRLGQTWGMGDVERIIYGSIVVLFEGVKSLLPFAILATWQRGHVVGLIIATTAFAGLVALSFLGTLGFAELNRGALQGTREQSVQHVATVRADIATLAQRLADMPRHRSLTEIDTDIDTALREGITHNGEVATLTALTAGCTKLVGKRSVDACARIGQLRRERAESHAHTTLQTSLDDKRTALSQAGGLDLIGIGDPQVAVVAKLAGLTTDTARVAINVAFAGLLELVGGLGLFIASLFPAKAETPTLRPLKTEVARLIALPNPESDTANAQRYLDTCVRRGVSGSVTASAMHRDYARWCATQRVTPVTLTAFGTFIARQGIAKAKVEGLVRYQSVALTSEEHAL